MLGQYYAPNFTCTKYLNVSYKTIYFDKLNVYCGLPNFLTSYNYLETYYPTLPGCV